MRLKDIATIKTGLVLSRKKAACYDVQKKYQKITLKSFSNSTKINPNSLDEFISNSEIKPEYLTRTNDIIIRLRALNIAICIDKNAQGLVISSLMSVIKLNDKNINSRFLAYYLNSKQSQKIFNTAVKGTAIPMIRTGDVAELDVFLPPISAKKSN
ncbi:restriction endonuclease subunit S [Abyssogena phaseoliformis symbiont]|uniref:restriction endonuclease subunit S n=1 Tax=Abyssogena phaseoliformis symbiont TaxID=596095 RepID=UPI0019158EA8|nr:restriction endonuclease subunit S [Abyssogena phaseoliformis symbiont]